jgi:hypothetical protein
MKRTMANGGERSCEYWQLAKDDLCEAYRNRCVYHKGNAVIPEDHDPTCLQGDALVLAENHDGLLIVVPNPKLSAAEQARLADTVAKLGLNQSAGLWRSLCRLAARLRWCTARVRGKASTELGERFCRLVIIRRSVVSWRLLAPSTSSRASRCSR